MVKFNHNFEQPVRNTTYFWYVKRLYYWQTPLSLTLTQEYEHKQSLLPNVKSYNGRYLIHVPLGLISPYVPFTYVPFWKVLSPAVNFCLYNMLESFIFVKDILLFKTIFSVEIVINNTAILSLRDMGAYIF